MMHNSYAIRRENGAALVVSLLLLAVLLLIGSGSLTTSRIETQIAENDEKVKQALQAAEYALTLGENTIEQTQRQTDLDFRSTGDASTRFNPTAGTSRLYNPSGLYQRKQQPTWNTCTWDDRDSIDIATYFADRNNPLTSGRPPLPPTLQDAPRDRPRVMIEEKHFEPYSLTIGTKPQAGVGYFNVSAHGGRARWTPDERAGTTHPNITYNDRYPGTRVVIQSVYAKRYN